MACGTPLVVSDNVGFRAVLSQGAEAVIVPTDDPATWAHTTIALLEDPARRAAMSRAGLAKAVRFAWPRIADETLAVYERVDHAIEVGGRGVQPGVAEGRPGARADLRPARAAVRRALDLIRRGAGGCVPAQVDLRGA